MSFRKDSEEMPFSVIYLTWENKGAAKIFVYYRPRAGNLQAIQPDLKTETIFKATPKSRKVSGS
jgi:hypothetical protein